MKDKIAETIYKRITCTLSEALEIADAILLLEVDDELISPCVWRMDNCCPDYHRKGKAHTFCVEQCKDFNTPERLATIGDMLIGDNLSQ
jgi:hypothetical protein